jgi:hypothetical protein
MNDPETRVKFHKNNQFVICRRVGVMWWGHGDTDCFVHLSIFTRSRCKTDAGPTQSSAVYEQLLELLVIRFQTNFSA